MRSLTETADILLKAATKLEKDAGQFFDALDEMEAFKKPITQEKAAMIWDKFLEPSLDTIKFFQGLEGKKRDPRLDEAYLAAGGDPAHIKPPRRPGEAKPSSLLNPLWQDIDRRLGHNKVKGLMTHASEMKRRIISLKRKADAARAVFGG